MTEDDAIALIRAAVPERSGHWADLGAGSGTFTRALASLIGPDGHVQAIEPDAKARQALLRLAQGDFDSTRAPIAVSDGDMTRPLPLSQLAGLLLANSLHFVPTNQQAATMRRLSSYLAPAGRLVLVEYDEERGNQWVPYPVSFRNFDALCKTAGLSAPTLGARMPSAFVGTLYAAWTSLV